MDGYEYTDAEAYERESYEAAAYDAAVAEREEYECRNVLAQCDICFAEGYGTQAALVNQGWEFFRGGCFCPSH